jgi:phosphoglycerate dehydrogenase-like enzyme
MEQDRTLVLERQKEEGINQAMTTATQRMLFALSSADRRRFIPDRAVEEEFAPGAHWIDVGELGANDWHETLAEFAPEVLVTAWDTPLFPVELARDPALPLRYVCHLAGGVRALPRSLLERGVLVSNWGECASQTVAEHALLLTLAALRNLPRWDAFMARMPENRSLELRTRTLHRRRVGLHGFGSVARQLARLLRPFEAEISAYSAGVPAELYERCDVRNAGSLEQLFARSEVLIECEALTDRTRGSVTAELLELLPDDAIFINVGRGAVVDEPALARCAARGKLRVALDVFEHEPLPADSPLRLLSDAVLSPHIAGPTSDTFALCGEFAMSNLHRYLRGETPTGLVTIEAYDRSS